MADIHKDIERFPEGYNTVVGERGVTLSGGQKQRIALARALLRDPAILILDDALSAVDTETEERILQRLRAFLQNRTSILIAHRISTIKDADWILVLDRGTIVEAGTHQDLISGAAHQAALPAALAIELIHTFTLIHDDIMDQSDLRRGKPTIHRKWDLNTAILTGDLLVPFAYHLILSSYTPAQAIALAEQLTTGLYDVCEGQAADLELEHQPPSIKGYLEMIELKTCRILQTAAVLGALCANNSSAIPPLQQFGYHLGIAPETPLHTSTPDLRTPDSKPGRPCQMIEQTVEVKLAEGLHARPAAELVKLAARFQSDIQLAKNALVANAKSIMSLLSLAADQAAAAIRAFFERPT